MQFTKPHLIMRKIFCWNDFANVVLDVRQGFWLNPFSKTQNCYFHVILSESSLVDKNCHCKKYHQIWKLHWLQTVLLLSMIMYESGVDLKMARLRIMPFPPPNIIINIIKKYYIEYYLETKSFQWVIKHLNICASLLWLYEEWFACLDVKNAKCTW